MYNGINIHKKRGMKLLAVIFVVLLGFLIFTLVVQKDMKNKGILASITLTNYMGLEIPNGLYKINAYENRFEFVHDKRRSVLPYERVENIAMTTDVERLIKNKGVVGRSIVGGAIGGATGAIVGGMTGQNKTKNQLWPYIVITYKDKDGKMADIIFKGSRISEMENSIITSFYKKIKKIVPNKESVRVL